MARMKVQTLAALWSQDGANVQEDNGLAVTSSSTRYSSQEFGRGDVNDDVLFQGSQLRDGSGPEEQV